MAVDPSSSSIEPENPQTWNRYSYVVNDPLSMVDNNGRYPTKVHSKIIKRAFPGLKAHEQRTLIKMSKWMDSLLLGGQSVSAAFKHGMRAPGQSVGEAAALANGFIARTKEAAQKYQTALIDNGGEGLSKNALANFGLGLHTVTDMKSPEHEGFQEWNLTPSEILDHIAGEAHPSEENLVEAITAAREFFRETFGDAAADAAFGSGSTAAAPSHESYGITPGKSHRTFVDGVETTDPATGK